MGNRVTIQDIADALGLSRNTVSKALNNADGLAEATRDRILQAAMDMGYKQFAYARSLAQDKTTMPSLAVGEKREVALLSTVYLTSPHFSSLMLDGIQRELSLLGLTLNSHRVTYTNLEELTLPPTLDLSRVAAIICVEMFDHRYDEMLCNLGVPMLMVDGPARIHGETLPCDQLIMENTTQVMRLVNDMFGRGITKIGFIGDWEHCQSFFERYAAFRMAMMLLDNPVDERFCLKSNHIDDIRTRLSSLKELPNLLVCANDFIALDVLQVLRELGLDVPRDMLLAGFDDATESRRSMPQLTTIHIHTQVMAYSAVQLLRTRIEEPSLDYRQVYTETELIYRASTTRD